MKLLYTPASPFVRKVSILVAERGLTDQITPIVAHPMAADAVAHNPNPLLKIPTLILEDGALLYDSPVICAYLDTLGDAPRFLPTEGPDHWRVLRAQALGDGLTEAILRLVLEGRRTDSERSAFWVDRWTQVLHRALPEVARDVDAHPGFSHLGHIAHACALGYLDFRFPEIDWRTAVPGLADWWEETARRPSIIGTMPEDLPSI